MKKPVTLVLFALVGLAALGSALIPARSGAQTPEAFEVVLPAHALDLDIPGAGGRDLRETVGAITAYADEEPCMSVDLEGTEGDVVVSLGGDDQPEACSREGAFVTFQNGQGYWLAAGFTLEPGARVTLENFAPVPPGAPPPGPSPTAAPAGPASGAITPPAAGNAGLRSP